MEKPKFGHNSTFFISVHFLPDKSQRTVQLVPIIKAHGYKGTFFGTFFRKIFIKVECKLVKKSLIESEFRNGAPNLNGFNFQAP